jgi:hypothetical protein
MSTATHITTEKMESPSRSTVAAMLAGIARK